MQTLHISFYHYMVSFTRTSWKRHYNGQKHSFSFSSLNDRFLCCRKTGRQKEREVFFPIVLGFNVVQQQWRWAACAWCAEMNEKSMICLSDFIRKGKDGAAVLITDSTAVLSCHWYSRSESFLITAVVKWATFTIITWLWYEYCSVRGGMPHTW